MDETKSKDDWYYSVNKIGSKGSSVCRFRPILFSWESKSKMKMKKK